MGTRQKLEAISGTTVLDASLSEHEREAEAPLIDSI